MSRGYVYVLSNPCRQGGYWIKGRPTQVAHRLEPPMPSDSGEAIRFALQYQVATPDFQRVVKFIHWHFRAGRIVKNDDLFVCDLDLLIGEIKAMAKHLRDGVAWNINDGLISNFRPYTLRMADTLRTSLSQGSA